MIPKKIIYYSDLLNDDFAGTKIKELKLKNNYKYIDRNIFYNILALILRIIVYPIVMPILKIRYLYRIKNRKVLKKAIKTGYFLYGNHTNYLLDAYLPTLINPLRKPFIVVSRDTTSIPGIKTIVRMLGAYPVPNTTKNMRSFRAGMKKLVKNRRVIAIYPEAHIWPFYNDIRPFSSVAMHYPYDLNVPSFSFTTIYKKRKFKLIKRPKVEVYIDGPFYPNYNLDKKEALEDLKNQIYNSMKKRINQFPKYNYYEYRYKENSD